MERNANLINRKIHQYILPGILMTVAMQLGNVVDGMIVGNILGPGAMAAIEISMPVLLVLQMPAMMLAMGGAAEAAVLLGKRDMEKADGVFTSALVSGAFISILFAIMAPFLPGVLSAALAGNAEMAALAEPYIMVNFAGIPILSVAIIFCYFMNADNHPQLGSALFIIANAVNLVLDFLFLKVFRLGMAGSALSTVTGYFTGMVTVFLYFKSRNRMLHIRKLDIRNPGSSILRYTGMAAKAGIPSAAFTLMSALKSVIINSAIVRFLGNDLMAVYSVCANAVLIAELCVGGIISLVQNIAGILFGEKDYYGIRTLCRRVLAYSYAAVIVLVIIFLVSPGSIASLFGIRQGSMAEASSIALRIFAVSFPFYVYNKFLMSYYQTVLQPGLSTVITVLQGFIAIVPLTLAGMYFSGMQGVCAAAVISEALTILISTCYRKLGQGTGKFTGKDQYMLPEVPDEVYLDFTIENNLEDVVKMSGQLIQFCTENGIEERKAKITGLALEEIAANIVKYGYRSDRKNYIDISFTIQDGKYLLRIRDDGIPFNPLGYKPAASTPDEPLEGGICLVRKMVADFQYMRVLNMNNTVIELDIGKHN